jgi:Tfp pilus assembly protein PilN
MGKRWLTGLILRGDEMEWTSLAESKGALHPVASGRCDLPPPAEDEAAFKERAEKIKKECAALHGSVSLAVETEQMMLRVLHLPAATPDELQGMVLLQMDKVAPFPIENMVVSHEELQRTPEHVLVLAAACLSTQIENTGAALYAAGQYPARVDAAVLGWWQLLRDGGLVPAAGRHLILLLDPHMPQIMVFQEGLPLVFRPLIGEAGMPRDAYEEDLAHEVALTVMTLELEHGTGSGCSITVWYPGNSQPAPQGMVARLRGEGFVDVAMESLEKLPALSQGIAQRLAAGGGINLIPASWRSQEALRKFHRRTWQGVAAAIAGWVVLAAAMGGGYLYQRTRFSLLEQERAALSVPANEASQLRRRVLSIRQYMDRRFSVLECLREIAALLPADVLLTSCTYRQDEGLKLSGEARQVGGVYDFKNKLDASPLFAQCKLQGPRAERGGRQVFDMDLQLRKEGAE